MDAIKDLIEQGFDHGGGHGRRTLLAGLVGPVMFDDVLKADQHDKKVLFSILAIKSTTVEKQTRAAVSQFNPGV